MSPDRTQAVVEARLGRPAQDRLEAAVVLEAWCGLRAKDAIEWGRRVVRGKSSPVLGDNGRESPVKRRNGTAEGISLMFAVVAVATWASPLTAQLGAHVWDNAVRVALPVTLAFQWLIWSRHLSGGEGLGTLRRESPVVLAALIAVLVGLLDIGPGGAVAGTLILIWVGGTVLASRGWAVWYAFLLVLVAAGLRTGVDPWFVLDAGAFAALAAVMLALGRSEPVTSSPGRWSRALGAATIGAGLGALLVTDDTIGWGFRGALPALALIPSAVGGFWAGRHLSRLYAELPLALEGVPAWSADRISVPGPALTILAGSVLRLAGATVVLSVACVAAGPATSGTLTTSLFVAFGCLALITLLVSLLVSLGRLLWAMVAVSAAVAVEVFLQLPSGLLLPGSGLIAGATVGALLMLPPIVKLLLRPGRALATAVWIL
jgi:hypothetical protein